MEVNQFVVTENLARAGYSCDIANNGREAVAAVTGKSYDVILMDCQMPEMSGFEAAAAIRTLERDTGAASHRVTIIALTANAVKGDRERCLAAGMDDYLTKPLNPAKLISCLEAHTPAATPAASASPTPVTIAKQAAPVAAPAEEFTINGAELLARCDGDKAMMGRLIDMFQQKSRQTWDNLVASVEARDAAGTARFAHALKGTSANLSASKVADLAARLEQLGRSAELGAAETLVRDLGVELERCRNDLTALAQSNAVAKVP